MKRKRLFQIEVAQGVSIPHDERTAPQKGLRTPERATGPKDLRLALIRDAHTIAPPIPNRVGNIAGPMVKVHAYVSDTGGFKQPQGRST